ncbi:hypothetical protein NUU61_004771 [Penicillium alfredii]|uniref:Uncharacterized protein n=1 Tax=Penicillium alfredii TaxID=1506179 RepID=A0A9W9K7A0_9EURO|nr:uncharacterized protein NUU61_004771 [Penicillium alfredii]KAJ5095415.1 hypothetical protein NUU61_004771 [Penicillium alfredii]
MKLSISLLALGLASTALANLKDCITDSASINTIGQVWDDHTEEMRAQPVFRIMCPDIHDDGTASWYSAEILMNHCYANINHNLVEQAYGYAFNSYPLNENNMLGTTDDAVEAFNFSGNPPRLNCAGGKVKAKGPKDD